MNIFEKFMKAAQPSSVKPIKIESKQSIQTNEVFPPVDVKGNANDINPDTPTDNPFYDFDNVPISSITLFANDSVSICAEACSCCWDKPCPESHSAKLEYIGKRAKTGHTSILEHSNMIIGLYCDSVYKDYLIELLTYNRYLKTLNKRSYAKGKCGIYLIIGGSWRAYEDLLFNIPNQNNPLLVAIKTQLYSYAPKEVFAKSINAEFLDEDCFFISGHKTANSTSCITRFPEMHEEDKEYIDVVNMDDIDNLLEVFNQFIYEEEREKSDYFTLYEIGDFANITICFKNMSRTATHQLVRHRNAITQESQRYVDYSTRPFINPIDYSKNKYKNDPNKRFYKINNRNLTLNEIAFEQLKVYKAITKDGTNPLHREDARAFLPSNIACGKLYMTFTYSSFAKFIELRTGAGAQDEIKAFATACQDWFYQYKENIDLKNFLNSRSSIINERYKSNFEESIEEEN